MKIDGLSPLLICIARNEMSVRVSHFETLRQRFPTWTELSAHLESSDGGSLRCIASGEEHVVVRYTKGKDPASDVFRSVVWDVAGNRPLCVAPFRAKEGLPPLNTMLSATEDFVDGFMMNAWVSTDGVLHVATRTQIGGDNKFYSEKTFGEMFQECVAASPLKEMEALRVALNKRREEQSATSAFASFVIQHPEHRVVARVVSPGLNVVHVGTVSETGFVEISERATNWPQALARLQVPSYPTRQFRGEKEVQELLRRTSVQRGWRWQGLVFKDGQGGRWRLRTPTYTMMRELRGSEATAMDRFFRLREAKKVTDYLKHYSEDRNTFWEFEQKLRARTADVLSAYVDVHKAHAVKFKELPEALRPAVFMLHVKWRDELRPKGFSVRLQNAIQVVNSMRSFEKRRLLEATEYQRVSAAAAPSEEGGDEEVAEEETTPAE